MTVAAEKSGTRKVGGLLFQKVARDRRARGAESDRNRIKAANITEPVARRSTATFLKNAPLALCAFGFPSAAVIDRRYNGRTRSYGNNRCTSWLRALPSA
jgi:hypothetical protein